MQDLLPDLVRREIDRLYRMAVAEAVHSFPDQRADEDAVTGALGHSMKRNVTGSVYTGTEEWRWHTTSRKLRGRGRGAPEKRFGVDAIIEMEVWHNVAVIGGKSLPVQSKIEWQSREPKLTDQAERISRLPDSGLIVDYRKDGFRAVPASVVAEAGGNRGAVAPAQFRDLGSWLEEDFLACRIGSRAMYYDAEREIVVIYSEDGRVLGEIFSADRRMLTKIQQII